MRLSKSFADRLCCGVLSYFFLNLFMRKKNSNKLKSFKYLSGTKTNLFASLRAFFDMYCH